MLTNLCLSHQHPRRSDLPSIQHNLMWHPPISPPINLSSHLLLWLTRSTTPCPAFAGIMDLNLGPSVLGGTPISNPYAAGSLTISPAGNGGVGGPEASPLGTSPHSFLSAFVVLP